MKKKLLLCPVCGHTKEVNAKNQTCSRSCGQRTPESMARNQRAGRKGGAAAGITRRTNALSEDYKRGWSTGYAAGRRSIRTGVPEELTE